MRQLLCLSLLLLPVAAAPDEKPAEDPRRLKPSDAPTPYTADEIRAGCPEGRTNVYRTENEGQVLITTLKFLKADEKGAEVEFSLAKEDGTAINSSKKTSTWKEFQSHGSFPEKDTKITEETIEVPCGKFDCRVYTVTQANAGKQLVLTFHFAKTLAGPPVRMVRTVDGKVASTMTLVECKMPEGKKEEEKPADGTKPAGN